MDKNSDRDIFRNILTKTCAVVMSLTFIKLCIQGNLSLMKIYRNAKIFDFRILSEIARKFLLSWINEFGNRFSFYVKGLLGSIPLNSGDNIVRLFLCSNFKTDGS